MSSSLDEFYARLQGIRNRVCCEGVPEILEICRDDLSWIGHRVLTCLLADRRDIIPAGSPLIFSSSDCSALGRRVMEKLFLMKVAVNESANLNLRGHIKVYSPGGEWMCELK